VDHPNSSADKSMRLNQLWGITAAQKRGFCWQWQQTWS